MNVFDQFDHSAQWSVWALLLCLTNCKENHRRNFLRQLTSQINHLEPYKACSEQEFQNALVLFPYKQLSWSFIHRTTNMSSIQKNIKLFSPESEIVRNNSRFKNLFSTQCYVLKWYITRQARWINVWLVRAIKNHHTRVSEIISRCICHYFGNVEKCWVMIQ